MVTCLPGSTSCLGTAISVMSDNNTPSIPNPTHDLSSYMERASQQLETDAEAELVQEDVPLERTLRMDQTVLRDFDSTVGPPSLHSLLASIVENSEGILDRHLGSSSRTSSAAVTSVVR